MKISLGKKAKEGEKDEQEGKGRKDGGKKEENEVKQKWVK